MNTDVDVPRRVGGRPDRRPAGLGPFDSALAGLLVVGALVVGRVIEGLQVRALHGGDNERVVAEAIGRVVGSVVAAIGIIWALAIVGVRLGPLVGALGIGGLAIAFAAQAILANFGGRVILQVRHPFRRGDQIVTGSCEWTVEDVNFPAWCFGPTPLPAPG